MKPILLKKSTLIKIFKTTINKDIFKGVLVSSLAKNKFPKTLTKAKAGTPYPKYNRAFDVSFTSSSEKDP